MIDASEIGDSVSEADVAEEQFTGRILRIHGGAEESTRQNSEET